MVSTECRVVHVERGYGISRNAKRLHEFISQREDVADALRTGLVREDVGVRKVSEKPVGFRLQALTSKGEIAHHPPQLLMANIGTGGTGALPVLPDAGHPLPERLLRCLRIAARLGSVGRGPRPDFHQHGLQALLKLLGRARGVLMPRGRMALRPEPCNVECCRGRERRRDQAHHHAMIYGRNRIWNYGYTKQSVAGEPCTQLCGSHSMYLWGRPSPPRCF